ncbi:hypothetical protein ABZZ74_53260 [Streptomyces sp. NPDC006476]|uniref:hypothetical protein n=1 Tax=Streptomyces sp. NPDC006476 TaxID=3157175 RepID=UPI0033B2659A
MAIFVKAGRLRCFSITLHTARDQVIQATGIVTADTDRDTLLGTIGRRILTGLLHPGLNRHNRTKSKVIMIIYWPVEDAEDLISRYISWSAEHGRERVTRW